MAACAEKMIFFARSAGALLRKSTKKQTADTTDRHGTATQNASPQLDAKMPKGRFQNRSSPFFKALNLSSDREF